MARIGFKRTDVITGGQYQDLYYDHIIIPDRRGELVGGYYAIEVDEDEISYNWLVGHMANVKWENLGIFAELPIANKTTPVPNWLPNNTYIDEAGDTQTYTLEEYGQSREDSLDGLKWVFKVTVYGDLKESQLSSLDAALTNMSGTGLTTAQARNLLNGADYTAPE